MCLMFDYNYLNIYSFPRYRRVEWGRGVRHRLIYIVVVGGRVV